MPSRQKTPMANARNSGVVSRIFSYLGMVFVAIIVLEVFDVKVVDSLRGSKRAKHRVTLSAPTAAPAAAEFSGGGSSGSSGGDDNNEGTRQQTGRVDRLGALLNSARPTDGSKLMLPIPKTVRYLYMNIGSSFDPWPGCGTKAFPYDPEVFCIYIDPLFRVNKQIRESELFNNATFMLLSAVSDVAGVAAFNEYAGTYGAASSLSPVSKDYIEKQDKLGNGKSAPYVNGARGQTAVTVLPLWSILLAVPPGIRILQIKTDMQGYDFKALNSGGELLKRVDEIYNECQGDGEDDIYANVNNRFSTWLPTMVKLGFASGDEKQHDCNWYRVDEDGTTPRRVPGKPYEGRGCTKDCNFK